MSEGPGTLPPEAQQVDQRLLSIAGKFEPALRRRVARLMRAVTESIVKLGDVDLVRHEANGEQGGHTLALWEELAPVMANTVQHVNDLTEAAQAAFPAPAEKDALDTLDDAFGPAKEAAAAPEPPAEVHVEIARLVYAVTSGMRRDVARLGERLRNPKIVSDAWMLISDLLEFRGRVRAGLGELIYQVCSFVAEVERQDVIPGYLAELDASLIVRQATSNLAFLFRGHAKRIAGSTDERILGALADALKDLHAFSRTRALPALRTSDKRIFLETRATLYQLAKQTPAKSREIKQAVENLARFLDSMSVVSRRENLRLHDRAQLAAVGRHLEQAQSSLRQASTPDARASLVAAVWSSSALYGRDAQLDVYLRAQRHFPVDWINDSELPGELERFGALLAAIPPP